MNETDFDVELREYQWRRKFERGRQRRLRVSIIPTLVLLMAVAIAAHSAIS